LYLPRFILLARTVGGPFASAPKRHRQGFPAPNEASVAKRGIPPKSPLAYDPKYTGDNWQGMPVTIVEVISNKATFTIKRGPEAAPGGVLACTWQESLKAAKDLQEGKETGGIGFYAPDIIIKGNMIDSITGFGYLFGVNLGWL